MNNAKRVVLISNEGYDKFHDRLLESLIERGIKLFCAVGKDCELWHDIMDELLVGDGTNPNFEVMTTWHPEESVDEVVEFAKNFSLEASPDVEIIEV